MQNNIIPIPNENNLIHDDASYDISLSEPKIKADAEMLSKDNQLNQKNQLSSNEATTEAFPLGQDNLIQNSANVADFSNQNGEQINTIPFFGEGNQSSSNANIDNFNFLGENTNEVITQTSGNDQQLDFFKNTSEQYTTEEVPKINAPKVFTSKILDDSKMLLSSYSIGHPEETNAFPLTGTTGDIQTSSNIVTNKDTQLENTVGSQNIDVSANLKNQNIDKRIDLSNPKIAELVKKYRTEVVIEPREEIKYIPVKKVRYVKILKVYVPKLKKIYVPGKKVVVPVKKKVYLPKPKNLESSQMGSSKLSTSTNPIMTQSTYVNQYSDSTNNFNNASINNMTTSVDTSVTNSQMFGINSINPSMSLIPSNKYMEGSTKVIEIPLASSNSSSNILQSSTYFGSPIGKSSILNYSYRPRVYSRSLSRDKLNNYD